MSRNVRRPTSGVSFGASRGSASIRDVCIVTKSDFRGGAMATDLQYRRGAQALAPDGNCLNAEVCAVI